MRVVVAITGASGVRYGVRLIEVLLDNSVEVDAIITRSARKVSLYEEGYDVSTRVEGMGVRVYGEEDFDSPYASSSSSPDAMVIAPCSMKTLAHIAHGISDNLVTRAALAVLRMGRRLVLVVRETPVGIPELRNMLLAAAAGAVILPASPGFYHKPRTIGDLVDFVVGKVLDVLGIKHSLYKRWGEGLD